MRKRKGQGAIFCILISAMLGQFACKRSDEIPHGMYVPPPPKKAVIHMGKVTGAARYSVRDGIYVKFDLSAEILSHDKIGGEVYSWSFSFNRNDKYLMQIGSHNYKDIYFNLSLYRTNDSNAIPANSIWVLSLKHDEGKSTPGYPFGQEAPNNMDFQVTIKDGNGHWQSFKVNVPFSYTPL